MMMSENAVILLQGSALNQLKDLGFSRVGFTRGPVLEAERRLGEWLRLGFHGAMSYLERRKERRDAQEFFPEVRSVLALAHPYDFGDTVVDSPQHAKISRYAWGEDYHRVLNEKVDIFIRWLEAQDPGIRCRSSVDIEPVLEKAWAQRAGIGWMGKHTNIIDAKSGSYFFLATVWTNLPFAEDVPERDRCGSCTRCIDVCPTGAIVAPYVLDARRCIAYLTIELKGSIPRELRPGIGNHVFGCDDCQEVCPWNRFSARSREIRFRAQAMLRDLRLEDLLRWTPEQFRERFQHSPLLRTKWRGLMRNALVAAGNSGDVNLVPLVKSFLRSEESLLREHAVWAYARLAGKAAAGDLQAWKAQESSGEVIQEIKLSLEEIEK